MKRFAIVLGIALVCSATPAVRAQAKGGMGLIMDVDLVDSVLLLETREGPRRLPTARTAAIRDEDGRPLTLRDLHPGDAVWYQLASEEAIRLHVARQFWALPSEP